MVVFVVAVEQEVDGGVRIGRPIEEQIAVPVAYALLHARVGGRGRRSERAAAQGHSSGRKSVG